MRTAKSICLLGLGIALYVVLGAAVKIPLIGHIQTDLGYIAFGAYMMIFGFPGIVVGAIGCVLESVIFSGWFPTGWLLGQIVIGIICALSFRFGRTLLNKRTRIIYCAIVSAIAIVIGILFVKTAVECWMYQIPFAIKFAKNGIACMADIPPMVIGIILGDALKEKVKMKQ